MISFEFHLEKWHNKTPNPLWFRGFPNRYLFRFAMLVAGTGCGCPTDTSVQSTEAPTKPAAETSHLLSHKRLAFACTLAVPKSCFPLRYHGQLLPAALRFARFSAHRARSQPHSGNPSAAGFKLYLITRKISPFQKERRDFLASCTDLDIVFISTC